MDHEYDSVLGSSTTLNARWVAVSRRLSPRVLTDLLEVVGAQAAAFLAALPPHETAFWPVAWAGEARSENWMDVGRDYTEYWHHQQQIRDAVGASAPVRRPLAGPRRRPRRARPAPRTRRWRGRKARWCASS